MQAYWKRYDRVERETRRRMEKEAEEQRKVEFFQIIKSSFDLYINISMKKFCRWTLN